MFFSHAVLPPHNAHNAKVNSKSKQVLKQVIFRVGLWRAKSGKVAIGGLMGSRGSTVEGRAMGSRKILFQSKHN